MKKLAISVILGSLLVSGNVMSTENYKPREFWENEEVVSNGLKYAVPIAEQELVGVRFESATDRYCQLASEITKALYPVIEKYMDDEHLIVPSKDCVFESIGLVFRHDTDHMRSMEVFLEYVGNIIGRSLNWTLSKKSKYMS